ncbi:MAG: hypothetical protein GY953_37595 [bacterium]|nr:hypothetical protein [bacterium]
MRPEEAEKLLGGYATGSLTSEERQALFAAALDDQKLFDTLADEEALRDALSDDTFRRELIATLSQTKPSLVGRFAAWWQRPSALAWAGACAAVVMAAVIVHQLGDPTQPPPQDIAMVSKQKVAPVPAPEIQRGLEAPAPRRFAQEVLVTGQDTKEPAQTAATAVSSSDRRDEPRKEPSMELAERDQAAPAAPQPRVAATPAEEAKSEVASMLDVVEAEMPVTAA